MSKTKWTVVVVAVCLVVTVAAVAYAAGKAKAAPEAVRAQRFELVDGDGRVWASLGFDSYNGRRLNGTSLSLRDNDGRERVSLQGGAYAPRLSLRDKDGKERVGLSLSDDGITYGLGLDDKDGNARAFMTISGDGTATVAVGGKLLEGGFSSAQLTARADGRTSVEIHDTDAKLRAALGRTDLESTKSGMTTRTAESSLVLFDREGRVLWQAP